jgi:hypothetical protein
MKDTNLICFVVLSFLAFGMAALNMSLLCLEMNDRDMIAACARHWSRSRRSLKSSVANSNVGFEPSFANLDLTLARTRNGGAYGFCF